MSGNQFLGFGLAASFVGFAALFGFARSGRFCFRLLFDRVRRCAASLACALRSRRNAQVEKLRPAINVSVTALAAAKASLFRFDHFLEPIRRARLDGPGRLRY